LIAKSHIDLVKIFFHIKEESYGNKNFYDAVLIDDNKVIRDYWELYAGKKGKNFISFESLEKFYSQISSIDRSCPIYINSDLGSGESGDIAARRLKEFYSFKSIFICTAYPSVDIKKVPWIDSIVGKQPTW